MPRKSSSMTLEGGKVPCPPPLQIPFLNLQHPSLHEDPTTYVVEPHSPSDPSTDVFQDERCPIWVQREAYTPKDQDWQINLSGTLLTPADEAGQDRDLSRSKWHGNCTAWLIMRSRNHQDFAALVSSGTPNMKNMAWDLFDRFGRLRSEFKDHPNRRGTGIWGDEISSGDILFMEDVNIDIHVRYRGKGRAVFESVVQSATLLSSNFVVITALDRSQPQTIWDALNTAGLRRRTLPLLQALGFRRIGNTPWLAYTLDPNHASHQLQPQDDCDPPPILSLQPHSSKTLRLHRVRWDASEESCISFFIECVRTSQPEDIDWIALNLRGLSIMHEAALRTKPAVLSWLKEHASQLTMVWDINGQTPLEALLAQLDRKRIFFPNSVCERANPDGFSGFTDKEVACVQVLEGKQRNEAHIRFGCTCCQCIGGYLSPRMMTLLHLHAVDLCESINAELICNDRFDHFEPVAGGIFHESNTAMYEILPPGMYNGFCESISLRRNFALLFSLFSQLFYDGVAPTDAAMMTYILNADDKGTCLAEFLNLGGTCQAIRRIVFLKAAASSERTGTESSNVRLLAKYRPNLTECRNDSEFVLAEHMCGLTTF